MSASGVPAGIIAAGWGERLRPAVKPLVPVGGVTLVERVLGSITETNPSRVVIIINASSTEVRDHVEQKRWPFPLRWLVETTPSSMHSFLRVAETLAEDGSEGPFLISTVDTVAPAGAFASFARQARQLAPEADVVLAITAAIDDEKPLLVEMAPGSPTVSAIGEAAAGSKWATAGYYSVRASVLREAGDARRDGLSALRAFLGRLLDRGFSVAGIPVADGIDVDRPSDVAAAEQLLRQVEA